MPIYCNDNVLLCITNDMVEGHKDYIKQAGLKEMKEETNTEDISKEEFYLYNIISACECILDDMENNGKISESNFNLLGYADGIMLRIQKEVNTQLTPTNIKHD